MRRALLTVSLFLTLAVVGYGSWLWISYHRSYQLLGDCGVQTAIKDAADASAYAERMVQSDGEVRRVSGISSYDEFVRRVNCTTAKCIATTDGVYWDVWFNSLPRELSDTWGGRVSFTRCRTHLRIWGA